MDTWTPPWIRLCTYMHTCISTYKKVHVRTQSHHFQQYSNHAFLAEKCSLCYELTHSTPGFAADPNNCAKFYMCEEHDGIWTPYPMMCPNCTFWDQDKLTCVLVDDSCLVSVPVPTDDGASAPSKSPLVIYVFNKTYFLHNQTYRQITVLQCCPVITV